MNVEQSGDRKNGHRCAFDMRFRSNLLSISTILALVVFVTTGCKEEPRGVTFGLNADDYRLVADALTESLLQADILDLPRVVVMGPIDSAQCQYRFNARDLATMIETRLVRSQRFRVSFASDVMESSRSGAEARDELMKSHWEDVDLSVGAEALMAFGDMADIDLILFGRVISQTSTTPDQTEVTYTFTWRLGDTLTGETLWAHQKQFVKTGPRIDGWFDADRVRIPVLVVPTAFTEHSERRYQDLIRQWTAQGYGHAIWHTLEDILYDTDILEVVTVPPRDLIILEELLNTGTGGNLTAEQRRVAEQIPAYILTPNMNFFERRTESVWGSRSQYHVHLYLTLTALDNRNQSPPVFAKGEARADDLLTATSEAARAATDHLIRRLMSQRTQGF